MMLTGRSAVVTGAGRGIGAHIAHALADAGAAVVLAARTREEIDEVAAAIVARGGRASAIICNVAEESSIAMLADHATSTFGAIDILINNAGIAHSALLQRTTLADWNRVMAVNATGAFLCTRAFLPSMLQRNWGRVVNVASVAGLSAQRYIAAYAASKHAMIGLMRAGAAEVAGTGVTMNAVCPGFADTAMTQQTVSNVARQTRRNDDESLALVLSSAGQERLITPSEVAEAVLRLCSDDASNVNGEALVIDGSGDA
jgi:3-hydroxybutyrate dehydrogenase